LLILLSAIGYYFIVYKEKNISFGKIFPLKPESVQLIPDELHGQHKGMTALTYSHCGDSKRARVRLRADAGFFGGKLLGFLEANRWGCVIVAKPYPTIRRRGLSARFEKLGGGWAAGEFSPQAHGWPKARRFVVVRRPVPEDPQAAAQLRRLTHRRSACPVLVANLKLFALASVALLRRAGAGGENDPRTARRSALEPDSLGAVPGHRGVLSDVAAGLQSGAWVQAVVPAQKLRRGHRGDGAAGLPGGAGPVGESGTPAGAALAARLSLASGVAGRGPGDPEIASAPKNLNLSVNLAHASNVDGLFYAPGTLHMHF
jgi:hypothetical protein